MSKKSPKGSPKKKAGRKLAKPTASQIKLRPLTSRLDLENIVIGDIQPDGGTVPVYNEYTDTTTNQGETYALQDGDVLLCGETALTDVTVIDSVTGGMVMDYSCPGAGENSYVEANMDYFDSFEEYCDEEDADDTPVYEGSDCDSGIGIRG